MITQATILAVEPLGNATHLSVVFTGDAGEKVVEDLTLNAGQTVHEAVWARSLALNQTGSDRKKIAVGEVIDLAPPVPAQPTAKQVWEALVSRALFADRLMEAGLLPVNDPAVAALAKQVAEAYRGEFL